jgi:predicted enzyme related to lactoylglutathione lyase
MDIDQVVSILNTTLGALTEPSGHTPAGPEPLIGDIDCLQSPAPDLKSGLTFYCDALGYTVMWRTDTAVGLHMRDSRAELVLQTERPQLETNLSVGSADAAAQRFAKAGGMVLVPPFDITIGRCTVVQDPWGNRLVLLDHRWGRLVTNTERSVVGVSTAE